MKYCTTEQFVGLIENLYFLDEAEKNRALDAKKEIDSRLDGYTYDEIKTVIEDHCIKTDGRFPPKLGYVILMAERNRPFRNPMPLDSSMYTQMDSLNKFVEKLTPYYQAWAKENKKVVDKLKYLRNKYYSPKTASELSEYNAERVKTVRELAEQVWEYRDSPFIKNSPVDPILWLIHRGLVFVPNDSVFLELGKAIGDMAANG